MWGAGLVSGQAAPSSQLGLLSLPAVHDAQLQRQAWLSTAAAAAPQLQPQQALLPGLICRALSKLSCLQQVHSYGTVKVQHKWVV